MANNKVKPEAALLSLFSKRQQEMIINYVRGAAPSELAMDLSRRNNPLLPPGVFATVNIGGVLSDEEEVGAVWAMATMITHMLKNKSMGEGYYMELLTDVFLIDPAYAAQLIKNIETTDNAEGAWDAPAYLLKSLWNSGVGLVGQHQLSTDTNSVDDDLDRSWELVQLGQACLALVKRHAVMASSMADMLDRSASADVERIKAAMLEAKQLQETGEIGDITDYSPLMGSLSRYRPTPIPRSEQGGLFDVIAKVGGKVLGAIGKLASGASAVLGDKKDVDRDGVSDRQERKAARASEKADDTAFAATRALDAIHAERQGGTMVLKQC